MASLPPEPGLAAVPSDQGEDLVVREEPLLIRLGEQAVLTMRTPGQDADLALGFLLAEGILERSEQVARLEEVPRGEASASDAVEVHLREGVALAPLARERLTRAHAVRASCGLCGLTSAEELTRHLRPLAPGGPRVTQTGLARQAEAMRAAQSLFARTGGSHAAAIFPAEGTTPWAVAEDVGRHNALDKVLGRCSAEGRDLSAAVVLLSGRAGYELVLKALRLGVAVVAAVSAPSSLAVELAEEHGQTLIAFLRDGSGRVYADDGRVAE